MFTLFAPPSINTYMLTIHGVYARNRPVFCNNFSCKKTGLIFIPCTINLRSYYTFFVPFFMALFFWEIAAFRKWFVFTTFVTAFGYGIGVGDSGIWVVGVMGFVVWGKGWVGQSRRGGIILRTLDKCLSFSTCKKYYLKLSIYYLYGILYSMLILWAGSCTDLNKCLNWIVDWKWIVQKYFTI